jgi:diguanylate cyclase (GGDEF)-like protein
LFHICVSAIFCLFPARMAAIVRPDGPEISSVESYESIIVGTAIQFSGTVLVTILCAILLRSIRRQFLYYWAAGWCALSVALAALLVGFSLGARNASWYSWKWLYFAVYCFGEYTAGYLWIAGCRNLFGNYRLTRRDWSWCVPAALVAVLLPWVVSQYSGKFDAVMVVHSLLMACLFATAFAVLYASRQASQGIGAGMGVMMAALFILTVDFLQYAPLCGYNQWTGHDGSFPHLKYSSLYDLMLEMLLAFGMVMVVMDHVRQELEEANRELRSTGSRLKQLAQCDPLTGALNRHAFDALLREARDDRGPLTGCVAILDLDNLKSINDTMGHPIGDRAIQLVAQTVRSIIRPDDLLFRWGGDEFLILWLGQLKEADATARLQRLDLELQTNAQKSGVDWLSEPTVSYGFAAFADLVGLQSAIQGADAQMYIQKSARRSDRALMSPSFP